MIGCSAVSNRHSPPVTELRLRPSASAACSRCSRLPDESKAASRLEAACGWAAAACASSASVRATSSSAHASRRASSAERSAFTRAPHVPSRWPNSGSFWIAPRSICSRSAASAAWHLAHSSSRSSMTSPRASSNPIAAERTPSPMGATASSSPHGLPLSSNAA
eukprot:scaffold1182_cov124-Isochrysis_galbana.AAC.8